MARPPAPLIVRERALQNALDLVDEVGYEAFSMPALAKRLGVQPPSLYHHFSNRAELLTEATLTVVGSAHLPSFQDTTAPWRQWCIDVALAMRDMILARPGVAPMVVWYLSSIGVPDLHRKCVDYLRTRGLSEPQSAVVVDALERMTLGNAGVEAMRNRPQNPHYSGDTQTSASGSTVPSRELFISSLQTFLAGVPDADPGDGSPSDQRLA